MPHHRLRDAFVLVSPHNKVQEVGQVGVLDAVLGALGVDHAVLVQREDAEPIVCRIFRVICWPSPARTEMRYRIGFRVWDYLGFGFRI